MVPPKSENDPSDAAAAEPVSDDVVTAALIVIGDEILSGRTKDKNIGHIAEVLNGVGIRLEEVRVVADVEERIVAAVNALRANYAYVFTTGGIGPTHDDITADSIAAALGRPIGEEPRAVAILEAHYAALEQPFTPARRRMTRMPDGSELIDNPVSAAPGFMVENVIVMAGIPSIMQAMLANVLPRLRKGRPMQSVSIHVAHPESTVSEPLRAAQAAFPTIPMGSYPFVVDGRYGTNLVLRGVDADLLAAAEADLRARLVALGAIDEDADAE